MASFAERPASVQSQTSSTGKQFYKGFEIVESYFTTNPFRDRWDHEIEYVLCCIGFVIGSLNIWNFPYYTREHGNIAFFVPYMIIMLVIALPIMYLESLLGQFSGSNQFGAFNFAPVCKGIGICISMVQFYGCILYIVYFMYSLKFIAHSFAHSLPWSRCDPSWGADENCYVRIDENNKINDECLIDKNCSICVDKQSAAEQFWLRAVLRLEDETGRVYDIENIGPVEWDLFGFLILSSFLEYFFIIKGIKSTGKIAYFTTIFPMVILTLAFMYSMTLKGANIGLYFFFQPDWKLIEDFQVWYTAGAHVISSLGIGTGFYIVYSSYNHFEFKIYRFIFLIVLMDCIAGLLSTFMLFAISGHFASILNCDITRILGKGQSILFVLIPEMIVTMPISQLWCVLYFLMFFTFGIDTQGFVVDSLITTIYEELPMLKRHKSPVRIVVCLILFLCGISCVTHGGSNVLKFLFTFAALLPPVSIILCELFAVMFVYGGKKFCNDVEFMLGSELNTFWKLSWGLIVPVLLTILFIFTIVSSTKFCDRYSYKICIVGWLITASCILPLPITAIIYIWKYSRTPYTWKAAFKPTHNWGPRDVLTKISYLDWLSKKGVSIEASVRDTLAELQKEVTTEMPTVKEVAMQRAIKRKMSVFHRFSDEFHHGEIRRLEAAQDKIDTTPL